jgi:hypothetical protein
MGYQCDSSGDFNVTNKTNKQPSLINRWQFCQMPTCFILNISFSIDVTRGCYASHTCNTSWLLPYDYPLGITMGLTITQCAHLRANCLLGSYYFNVILIFTYNQFNLNDQSPLLSFSCCFICFLIQFSFFFICFLFLSKKDFFFPYSFFVS